MKIARTLSFVVVLATLVGGRPAPAEGWSVQSLNPFAGKEPKQSQQSAGKTAKKPSPLARLNAGTKEFFSKAKRTLTPNKAAEKEPAYRQHYPWNRPPRTRVRHQSPKKQTWLSSLFRRKESKPPPQSLDDWMNLKRMDP